MEVVGIYLWELGRMGPQLGMHTARKSQGWAQGHEKKVEMFTKRWTGAIRIKDSHHLEVIVDMSDQPSYM